MADVFGPIIAILLIFGVYYAAQKLDMLGDTERANLDIKKTEAKIRHQEAEIRKRELEVEMGKLAIEAKRLEFNPIDAAEVEFKVLKELEDKTEEDELSATQ